MSASSPHPIIDARIPTARSRSAKPSVLLRPARWGRHRPHPSYDGGLMSDRLLSEIPAITYPAELPVSGRREDIARAIRDHQVVIVAGATGSGKTTQLP